MRTDDVLRDALLEIGVVDPVDPVTSDFQSLALTRVNGILDLWNVKQETQYAAQFPEFTLVPGLSPHTIGLAANTSTFAVTTNRPTRILGANLELNNGVNLVKVRIDIRDKAWWLGQPTPNITSGIPTDLYYSPDWPNGSLYFWPVPNSAYKVQLEAMVVLAQLALGQTFTLPPGYQRALTLTLAEDLVTPFSVPMPIELPAKARAARAAVFGNNNDPIRVQTRDYGMPGGMPTSGGFNWQTGRGGGR